MAGYIGNVPVAQATQTRDNFTAVADQTSFATSGYTPGYLDVYLNGVHLDPSDYTATNGSDVVLDSGAAADDVLTVVSFTTFETHDNPIKQGMFIETSKTLTSNYTITTGKNAMSAGPITIDDNAQVTVPDGSTWTIV